MALELNEETRKVEKPLDAEWCARFEKLGSFQAYDYLGDDAKVRDAEKLKFFQGEIQNPTLRYPQLSQWLRGKNNKSDETLLTAQEREQRLLLLKAEIINTNSDNNDRLEAVKRAYQWRINEKLAELRMMWAIDQGDMRAFDRYTRFIYGTPNTDVFKYTLGVIEEDILKTTADPDMLQAQAALKAVLPTAASVPSERMHEVSPIQPVVIAEFLDIKAPTSEMVDTVRDHVWKNMGILRGLIERTQALKEQDMEAKEIKAVFDEAIELLGAKDWKVVITTDSKTAVSVSQERKSVEVPNTRKAKATKIAALVAHEIGTHVNRRRNGERSSLKLLSLGLDRYEGGEEGIAGQAEKVVGNEKIKDFTGFEMHLGIALAKGLDRPTATTEKGRDFKEVFDILYKYIYCQKLPEHKKKLAELNKKVTEAEAELASFAHTESPDLVLFAKARETLNEAKTKLAKEDSIEKKAQEAAWRFCIRIFRGTDCKTAGVCFTKDMIYREGQIGIWDLLNSNANEMKRVSVGKYDPTNVRHLWLLTTLGISDEDLVDAV